MAGFTDAAKAVIRCNEIQTALGSIEVPEFETLPEMGMAARLALHIQGLPLIKYELLKLVASHYLKIPKLAVERVVRLLAEVEFVRLQTQGTTIIAVLPTVPFYEKLYNDLGQFVGTSKAFNEPESLALAIVERLANSPEKSDSLSNKLGSDNALFRRSISIGTQGNFLISRRFRGRDILINPSYFSENADIFADAVAKTGSKSISSLLKSVRQYQGWPLGLIEKKAKLGESDVAPDQIELLRRLAQDGMVKPPTIETPHSGKNHFIFTPTPASGVLSLGRRDIYEKAMAIVAAIRQGQLLPKAYAIRSPGAVLYTLQRDLQLGRATTEANQQYKQLSISRIAMLEDVGGGFSILKIIDTPENREALDIAYDLVNDGASKGLEVDQDARKAMQQNQEYVESAIASAEMRKTETVTLSEEQSEQLELLFMRGLTK
jgi:hypothetical protein